MANLLLFRKPVLAIASAAVLTLSAGDVTLKLNPTQSAWPNLLFRTIPNKILASTAELSLSGQDPSWSQAAVTITLPDTATLTLSADSPDIDELLLPENAVLALSAQPPTLVAGAVTITPENAVLTLSAADAGITPDLRGVLIYINGANRSAICRLEEHSLEQQADDHVGSFSVIVNGTTAFVPTKEMEVQVYQGSLANVQYGGTIQDIELVFPREDLTRVDYRLHCVDFRNLFNRILIFERFQTQSASTVAAAIVGRVPGFNSAVQIGLPTITDIDFAGVGAADALAQLAEKVGATSVVGPDKRVHFSYVETADAPDPLDAAHPYRELQVKKSSAGLRNRVYAHGKGQPTSADVLAGATTIPLRDVDDYPASGQVLIGSQVASFTGKSTNAGQGSTTDGPLTSMSAPTAASVAAVSASPLGSFRYAVSHVIDGRGETEISPLSGAVVVPPLAPPFAGSGVIQNHTFGSSSVVLARAGNQLTIISGLGQVLLPGAKVRISGSSGNAYDGTYTIASVNSALQPVISGVSTFGASFSGAVLQMITAGPHVGTQSYRMTYEGENGTTLGGTQFDISGATAFAGVFGGGAALSGVAGGLTTGASYTYWIGWQTERGIAGLMQLASLGLSFGATAVDLSSLPVSTDPRAGNRVLFRSRAVFTGGAALPYTLATVDATSTTYRDTAADSALGALASVADCGCAIGLYNLPASPDPRVKRKGLYRFDYGGTNTFRRMATLDNAQSWFFDAVDATALGEVLPSAATFGGMAIDVTVSSAPSGTLSTKIWRTKDGGSAPFQAGTLSTPTGVFRDTRADADLVEPAPVTSTLSTLPGATSLRVKSTANFTGGGHVRTGSQVLTFTGVSGDSIVGIPSSGPGSITAPIAANAEVVIEPHLRGVSGLVRAVTIGDVARIRVMVEDTAAQAAIANPSTGDNGVREHKIENAEWSYATALLAAQADLDLNKTERVVITFKRDGFKDLIGKTIAVNLPSLGLVSTNDFTIVNVTVSELGKFRKRYAERTVTISNAPLMTFDDYLRRLDMTAA